VYGYQLANIFFRSKEFLNEVSATRITSRLARYFSSIWNPNHKGLDEYPDNIIYFIFIYIRHTCEVSNIATDSKGNVVTRLSNSKCSSVKQSYVSLIGAIRPWRYCTMTTAG
jgi:hypothetical protein